MKKNFPITENEIVLDENTTIISTTDLKGKITYINREFIRISGYSEEELIGKNHNVVRHPDMPPMAFKNLWNTVAEQGAGTHTWRGVVKNRCKNGDFYWVDAFVIPVTDSNNKLLGYQSVRTKPDKNQVNEADKLYKKINNNEITSLPKVFKFSDVSIMKKMAVALVVAAVLPFVIDVLNSYQVLSSSVSFFLNFVSPVIIILTLFMFYKSIMQPIYNIVNLAKGIAGGNLNQSIVVDNKTEVGELLLTIKLMQSRLQTIIGKLTETSENITKDAHVLSTSSEKTFGLMHQQQHETQQVASAMNEMYATVSGTKNSTEEALQEVVQASDSAKNGKNITDQVHASITELVQKIENTSDAILELEDKSDDIVSTISVIDSIADQTNLLALNASIEAARAGEQGRGFAVVADEVRMLASRTQSATKNINKVIDELRSGINKAVHVMGSGRKHAYDSIENSKLAAKALIKITESIEKINDMNSHIVTATSQQTIAVNEMDKNIININQMSLNTVEATQYNNEASVRLKSLSNDMEKQISNFELGNVE